MKLYHLNKEAQEIALQIIDGITEDLSGDESKAVKHIGEKDGAYMRLSVECLLIADNYRLFSFAHYYEQNGDLMRDPEVVFYVNSNNHFFPMQFTQDNFGMYQEYFHFQYNSLIQLDSEEKQRHCKDFCNQWMQNIKDQHPEYFRVAQAA